MRRRAVLVVEYEKESGYPLTAEQWEARLGSSMTKVRVEVQSDD